MFSLFGLILLYTPFVIFFTLSSFLHFFPSWINSLDCTFGGVIFCGYCFFDNSCCARLCQAPGQRVLWLIGVEVWGGGE